MWINRGSDIESSFPKDVNNRQDRITEYCYSSIPYGSLLLIKLRENVVIRILENISDQCEYNVTSDNFCTIYCVFYLGKVILQQVLFEIIEAVMLCWMILN